MFGTGDFSGGTVVAEGGVLWLPSDAGLGAARSGLTLDNGKLQNRASNTTVDAARTLSVGIGGGVLQAGWSRRLVIDGNVEGSGQLTVAADSGVVFLNSLTNTYEGGTLIQGFLQAKENGTFGEITSPITFDGGTVKNNNSDIVWGDRDITLEVGGGTEILGDGVSKANVEVGTSLGTGDILIDGGKLKNRDSDPVFAQNLLVDPKGARVQVGWTKTMTIDGVVSGTGDITVEGDSGTLILAGANTFTGNLILASTETQLARVKVTGSLGGGAYDGVISGDGLIEFAGMALNPSLRATPSLARSTSPMALSPSMATRFPTRVFWRLTMMASLPLGLWKPLVLKKSQCSISTGFRNPQEPTERQDRVPTISMTPISQEPLE